MDTPGFSLLDQAAELQQKAHAVLQGLKLLERWSAIGKPILVGSLRFGLLCSPNLDMEIYTDSPNIQDGFEIISALATVPGVNGITYMNAMDTADQGLYWRIDYTAPDGTVWDIDNWLVAHDHPNAGLADGFAQAMAERLDDEARLAILRLKAARGEHLQARGIDIYKAVLVGGVNTPEEYLHWSHENPPVEIELWTP